MHLYTAMMSCYRQQDIKIMALLSAWHDDIIAYIGITLLALLLALPETKMAVKQ